jgi:hypothetical protein
MKPPVTARSHDTGAHATWQRLLAARRSRFWHHKGALDLLTDATEPGSLRMLGFTLRSRLSRSNIAAAKDAGAIQPAPRTPRIVPAEASAGSVPPLTFQTWKVRDPLPANFGYWSATLSARNPARQHIIWDDQDNREFIVADFPWFLPGYDRYPQEIYRADIVRLFFLYRFGGLYADMDTECLRPVDKALASGDVILGSMGPDSTFAYSIPNAVMAAKPRQLFWLLAIANAIDRAALCRKPTDFLARGPEYLTGAVLIRDSLLQYRAQGVEAVRQRLARSLPANIAVADAVAGDIVVLAPAIWYPINWNNLWHQRFRRALMRRQVPLTPDQVKALFPAAHLVAYWTHSW